MDLHSLKFFAIDLTAWAARVISSTPQMLTEPCKKQVLLSARSYWKSRRTEATCSPKLTSYELLPFYLILPHGDYRIFNMGRLQ